VRIGAPDAAPTPDPRLAVVSELCGWLGVIEALDAAVGPSQAAGPRLWCRGAAGRDRSGAADGENLLVGLDRQRAAGSRSPGSHPP
jgi:hypothetical protein